MSEKVPPGAVCTRLWSLSEDVLVESEADRLVTVSRWGETVIEDPGPGVREMLERMSLGPVSLENVLTVPTTPGTTRATELANLHRTLDLISGSVEHSLALPDGGPLLVSASPVVAQAPFVTLTVGGATRVRLSRFSAVRAVDGHLQAESPLGQHRVLVHSSAVAAMLTSLASPTRVADIVAGADPLLAPAVVAEVVAMLVLTQVVVVDDAPPGSVPAFAEDTDPDLMTWSHHDLVFHAQSRLGRNGGPFGAIEPSVPARPVTRPIPPGPRYGLPRPSETASGMSLVDVLEGSPGPGDEFDEPPSREDLGTLLFRAARIRTVESESRWTGMTYEVSDRPYPSVARLYELELYLLVDRCTGLPRGVYHYDPRAHALTLMVDSATALDEVLDTIRATASMSRRPPVVVGVACRIARRSWVYGGIAYAAALMHLGVLHQTLNLVAVDIGLGARIVTTDTGELLDRALDLDGPAETTIGEMVIGRPAQP